MFYILHTFQNDNTASTLVDKMFLAQFTLPWAKMGHTICQFHGPFRVKMSKEERGGKQYT